MFALSWYQADIPFMCRDAELVERRLRVKLQTPGQVSCNRFYKLHLQSGLSLEKFL